MDFSTMSKKLENFEYLSLESMEADFTQMVDNCLSYNERDTIFFRLGVKMRDQGGSLIRQARRQAEVSSGPTFSLVNNLSLNVRSLELPANLDNLTPGHRVRRKDAAALGAPGKVRRRGHLRRQADEGDRRLHGERGEEGGDGPRGAPEAPPGAERQGRPHPPSRRQGQEAEVAEAGKVD